MSDEIIVICVIEFSGFMQAFPVKYIIEINVITFSLEPM